MTIPPEPAAPAAAHRPRGPVARSVLGRAADVIDVFAYVVVLKGRVLERLRAATTRPAKVVAALSLWLVAAGSKFVVLWLVDLVFGDDVSLGGFFSVTVLVVALLASRAAVRRLLAGSAGAL